MSPLLAAFISIVLVLFAAIGAGPSWPIVTGIVLFLFIGDRVVIALWAGLCLALGAASVLVLRSSN